MPGAAPDNVSKRLSKLAGALFDPALAIAFLLLLCVLAFGLRGARFEALALKLAAPEASFSATPSRPFLPVTIFDTQTFGYDARQAAAILDSLRRDGVRELYTGTQLSLDLIFPALYGLALYRVARLVRGAATRKWLACAALLATGMDVAENLCSVALVHGPDVPPRALVWLGSTFTQAKTLLIAASVLALLIVSRWFWRIFVTRISLAVLALVWLALPLWTDAPLTLANLSIVKGDAEQFWAFAVAPITMQVMLVHVQLGWVNALDRLALPRSPANRARGMRPARWWRRAQRAWRSLPVNTRVVLRAVLVAGFVAPLLVWCARSNDLRWLNCLAGFSLGMLLATFTHVYATWLGQFATWLRQGEVATGWLGLRIFVQALLARLERAPGYRNLPEHVMALLVLGLFVATSFVLYLFTGPCGAAFPTLGYVLILATAVASVGGGLCFLLDRYHVPVVIVALTIAVVWSGWQPRYHQFNVAAVTQASSTPLLARCKASSTARTVNVSRASLGGALPQPVAPLGPAPALHLLERLKLHESSGGTRRTLVVVSASGGGIQAAAWTTLALAQLQSAFGERFSDSVYLASGASGGSVGIYFWLEGLRASLHAAPGKADEWAASVHCGARASSLQASAWGLAFPDSIFLAFADARDRGWAIEEGWLENLDAALATLELGAAGAPLPRTRVSELGREAALGELPGFVFNATVVDTGALLALSNLEWDDLNLAMFRSRGELWSTERDVQTGPPTFLSLEGVYGPAAASWDIDAVSAARLSATFPYVTPAATPRADPPLDEKELRHVIDGGLFDNQGVVAGVQYLHYLFGDETIASELEARFDRVLVLRLEAYGEAPPAAAGPPGAVYQALAPISTLMRARSTTQERRSDLELRLLRDYIHARAPSIRFREITLRPRPLAPTKRSAPLSWQLDACSIQRLGEDWAAAYADNYCDLEAAFLDFAPSALCLEQLAIRSGEGEETDRSRRSSRAAPWQDVDGTTDRRASETVAAPVAQGDAGRVELVPAAAVAEPREPPHDRSQLPPVACPAERLPECTDL